MSLARCLNNLATLRLDHRALAEALPLLEDSVAIFQRLHNAGETHWDAELAGTMTNLAAAYRHQGRLTAATELRRALAMRQALARSGTLAGAWTWR
ncbi:MAG: tetratricopeptide repeat protein [Chloroflexia bacterium]